MEADEDDSSRAVYEFPSEGSQKTRAADVDAGIGGVGAVDVEAGVGGGDVGIVYVAAEEDKGLEGNGENKINMEGDAGVVETGESGEFRERVLVIGDQEAKVVVSEELREADCGDDDVGVKEEGVEGTETVGDGDNEFGTGRKEDVAMLVAGLEGSEVLKQISGIPGQAAEEVAPLDSDAVMEADVGDADVGDADMAAEEEMDGINGGGDGEFGAVRKEDVMVVVDVRESGGFDKQGIGGQAVELAEWLESEDVMEADVEDAGKAAEEEMAGIESVLGGHNESDIERKEDVLAVPDVGEYRELSKHVVGIYHGEAAENVESMVSGDMWEKDVGVTDIAKEEEDAGVHVKGDVFEEGGIDYEATTEDRDDVVSVGVDGSWMVKEEEGVALVVEGDGTAMAEEVGVDVGSRDVMLDREAVELEENEIKNTTIDDSSCNEESMSEAVSLSVKENGISNLDREISLVENDVVTDGGGESRGVVLMVDETSVAEKDIGKTYVAINTGANTVMAEDENDTVDRIGVGDDKLVAAGVVMLSDDVSLGADMTDVSPGADKTNGMENADDTGDRDDNEVTSMSDKIGDVAVGNNPLGDKVMDDVVDEIQAAEDVDRTEETYTAEVTYMSERETEKVEQQERNVVLYRKVGRSSKGGGAPSKKKILENICFCCFSGGDLVRCDRRGCPKVYHPSCIDQDESFFQTKDQWNCGLHFCSSCKKNAYYFCYTCTFSLCKGCIKDAGIYVVRGNKGFCDRCMKTVRMIESVIQGHNQVGPVDFDDKTSWEYLFKDYYMDLKEKLSLSAEEIRGVKNPWKGTGINSGKLDIQDDSYDVNNDGEDGSGDLAGRSVVSVPKKRKAGKQIKSPAKDIKLPRRSNGVGATDVSRRDGVKWATKELLDFVMYMRKGDVSILSQFDVQALLLEYIKTNKLRDPRKKSQIICDSRLQNLFGKSRVGHFEMLKLLESHFPVKDNTDDLQGSVVNTDVNQVDVDQDRNASVKAEKQKKHKTKNRGEDRGLQSNVDDYAAIDPHNITLIFLRQSLVEYLLEDTETFDDKVIGSFVRIRIPGNNPKQETYRIVPIIGISKVSKPYKVGKKHTDYVLEIQNLRKAETIQIDEISNQEFTQEECFRLKQSMKYGIINRLTVGDIQDKAISLQEARVKDWLDAEITRVSHLRDRASEIGHAKELRECVEKLQRLKTPQERQRRLKKLPEIHADPKMDPNNESEDDEDIPVRGISTASGGRSREPISPSKGVSSLSKTSRDGPRTPSSRNNDVSRSMSGKGLDGWREDGTRGGGDVNQISSRNKTSNSSSDIGTGTNTRLRMESTSGFSPETPVASRLSRIPEAMPKVNESEKMWQYKDPSGKIHGLFSMAQLRKWNNTGYFPVDLRIWRSSETQDDSIFLADALKGKQQRDTSRRTIAAVPAVPSRYSSQEPVVDRVIHKVTPSMDIPKFAASPWSSSLNFPSPTPQRTQASIVKGPDEVKWPQASSLQNGSAVAQSSAMSLIGNGGISGADALRNVSSVLAQDPNALMNAASALLAQSQSALPVQQRLTVEAHVQKARAPEMANPGLAIQYHNPATNVLGWGSAPAPTIDLAKQPPISGHWGEPPVTAQNPASFGMGGSTGTIPYPWRSNPGEELSMQSVPGANRGASSNNVTNAYASVVASSSLSQQNLNPAWMQVPGNTGWPGSAPGNASANWSANLNTGQPLGPGTMLGWNPPSQGHPFGNPNNAGPVPPNQAPPSSGWSGPSSDGSYREWVDSGYGGGRPGDRQSSLGGGRDQSVCWYHDEYGNCRRGASCKFRHA